MRAPKPPFHAGAAGSFRRPQLLAPAGRAAAVAVLVWLGMLLLATPATAHAALLFSSPSADSGVLSSPQAVTLVFGEPVTIGAAGVSITAADGHEQPVGPPAMSSQQRVATVPVDAALPPGLYTVRWIVTSPDGDLVEGSFRFGVGEATVLSADAPASSTPWERTASTAVLRWLLFAGLALAGGGLVGEWIMARTQIAARPRAAWVTTGAWVLTACACALAALLVVHGGSAALTSPAGWVLITEAAAGALAAWIAATRWRRWALLALLLVAAAEAYRSHLHESAGLLGAGLTFVHLCAAALWTGALVVIVREAWRQRDERSQVRRLLAGYARLALVAALIVLATGTASALLLVGIGDLVETAYGRVLLAKVALVTVAVALALVARKRLRAKRSVAALSPARVEAVTLIAVLAATGLLVSLAPPRAANQSLPFAPPPVGVVIPIATRAGQVGVFVQASAGQLRVNLFAPGSDDQRPGLSGSGSTEYGLTADLAAPGAPASPVTGIRGCGDGCFVAPATWATGVSRLHIAVAADGWAGGSVLVLVPWPGRSDPALLRRVVQVMSAIPSLTLYETVTSDTSRPTPKPPDGFQLSGKRYIDSEPYAGGAAPIATIVEQTPLETRLLLAFPADDYTLDMRIDNAGRILHETLVTDNEYVTRTLVYPDTRN